MSDEVLIRPQPGPQTAFASSRADIAIFGGAAGGGKSFALMLDSARYVDRVERFFAIYLRRTYPQLTGPDGLWDLSHEIMPHVGGRAIDGLLEWHFPNKSRIVMRHLQHDKDIYSHQSLQYAAIYWDELTHFTEKQFWYMLSRNRSTCGVRPFVRASTNPDPDSFVARLIDWWIDEAGDAIPERSGRLRWFVRINGELQWGDSPEELTSKHPGEMPLSLTFIASRLQDNPALTSKDTGYEARLRALPYVERMRLLGGNWQIRPAAGLYFKRHWFRYFDEVPGNISKSVRAWDKGATAPSAENPNPDWTRGILFHELQDAPVRYLIADAVGDRCSPGSVDRLMLGTAERDGTDVPIAIWVDPGQAGKVDLVHTRKVLDGWKVTPERAAKSKEVYAGPVSSAAEGGLIGILRRPWTDGLITELEGFNEAPHDDYVDALSLAHRKIRGVPLPANAGGHTQTSRHRVG